MQLRALFLNCRSLPQQFLFLSLPFALHSIDLLRFLFNSVRDHIRVVHDAQLFAKLTILDLQSLFALTQRIDFFRQLFVASLGELVGILEFLVLGLILLEHISQLCLLFILLLGLLFVGLNLFGQFFSLFVNLTSESVLDATLLVVLLFHLLGHQLDFLSTLFLQGLVFGLQVFSLSLDQVVFLF